MATSIRLAPESEQRLDFLASQTGRTKAFYLRQLIERGLGDLEDYYLAADVLERLRKGNEEVHSSVDVRSFLDLTIEYTASARNRFRNQDKRANRRIIDYMD